MQDVSFCAECKQRACTTGTIATDAPNSCPSIHFSETVARAKRDVVEDPRLLLLAQASARTEAEGYLRWTRVEEIVHFAQKIGAKKLGIATCAGLLNEASIASRIFRAQGFTVHSVCCKVGSFDKCEFGLGPDERIHRGEFEANCMPVAQADVLNDLGTDLNVVIGLCVGHDSMFFMRSKAPATVLVAKDRVTGHNPVAALYTSSSYYRKLTSEL